MKTCGTCTECCSGALTVDVYGQVASPGVPCRFRVEKVGCSIYKDRPVEPCSTYRCLWLADPDFPDHLKPEHSGGIFDIRWIGNVRCLFLSPCGDNVVNNGYVQYVDGFGVDLIDWGIQYAKEKNLEFAWYFRGNYFYYGSEALRDAMKEQGLL